MSERPQQGDGATIEYVSFRAGKVVHLRRPTDERTLCDRECEGFANAVDAEAWAMIPAARCKSCAAASSREGR